MHSCKPPTMSGDSQSLTVPRVAVPLGERSVLIVNADSLLTKGANSKVPATIRAHIMGVWPHDKKHLHGFWRALIENKSRRYEHEALFGIKALQY